MFQPWQDAERLWGVSLAFWIKLPPEKCYSYLKQVVLNTATFIFFIFDNLSVTISLQIPYKS